MRSSSWIVHPHPRQPTHSCCMTEPRSRPGHARSGGGAQDHSVISSRTSIRPPWLCTPGRGHKQGTAHRYGSVLVFRHPTGRVPLLSAALSASGAAGIRTPDLRRAKAALSQLSYDPVGPLSGPPHPGSLPPVGAPGLEPGTSVLSGPRSNHLSYAPRRRRDWVPAPKTE
jgi:hypothetical protein